MAAVNLQDLILNAARKEKIPVTVFLTNGFQTKGIILGYDSYVIVMDVMGKQNMIYKHAVSTIAPMVNIKYSVSDEKSEAAQE